MSPEQTFFLCALLIAVILYVWFRAKINKALEQKDQETRAREQSQYVDDDYYEEQQDQEYYDGNGEVDDERQSKE